MDGINEHLYHYQVKSIEMANKYIKSTSKSNCLIKLPTGAGKTGVISIISYQFTGNVLIIVPNATLPGQTAKEISDDFWNNIKYKPPRVKKVKIIHGGNSSFNLNTEDEVIFIITIQTLLSIYENDKPLFKRIKDCISLILYDEGHREPAIVWSEASRELAKKTILFTATPYRNDNYVLKIDKKFTYTYTMKEAIEEGFVKKPEFVAIPDKTLTDDSMIVKFILNAINNKEVKALIRCNKSERIKILVEKLNRNDVPTLGCHSAFTNREHLLNTGDKVLKESATYPILIHCDMLIEGVNIPQLNTLFLLDDFNNMKTTIQQIGRVLRPSSGNTAYIYVPEKSYSEISNQWDTYIESELYEENYMYVDGKFREKFSFEKNGDLYKALRFQTQANIYVSDNSFFDRLKVSIEEQINKVGNLESFETSFFEAGNLWVLCYQRKEPSKILIDSYYFEYSLEYISLVEIESNGKYYYFYYNSRRYAFPDDLEGIRLIDRNSIFKLIPKGSEIRNAKYTSTSNSKIGARTKAIDGMFLNSIPGNLAERLSFCRCATGYYFEEENKTIRYLSSITSKISEKRECTYLEYIEWCKQIIRELNNNKQNAFFNRFAIISDIPKTPPTSILIDLNCKLKKDGEALYIESQFCEVNGNKFDFYLEGAIKKGTIITDQKQGRTRLYIDGLEDYLVGEEEILLSKYLQKNNIYVYYANEQIMYYQGYYFKPNIKFFYSTIEDFGMWENIIAIDKLANCKNEKLGEHPEITFKGKWPTDSIFGIIVNEIEANTICSNIDYLICDDLNYEIADFIALSKADKKIIFIHCKYENARLSASAFQDVCGQAVKNIEYLISTNPESLIYFKSHVDLWKGEWSLSKDGKTYSTDRCVIGSADSFVEEYKKILQDPNAKKEVWLVTSGLSKQALKTELLKKEKQGEQFQQLMFILHSTQDSLSQVNVNMRIICKN